MLTEAQRKAFDHAHGGTSSRTDAEEIAAVIAAEGVHAEIEDSVDLFRVYIPDRRAYFWPSDTSPQSWAEAAGIA